MISRLNKNHIKEIDAYEHILWEMLEECLENTDIRH